MKKIDKNVWITVSILVVLILFTGFYKGKNQTTIELMDRSGIEDISDINAGINKTVKSYSPTPRYTEAVALYRDRRIQLDVNCQAILNNLTFKNHTKIMIDNRSPFTRTVKIGKTMTINPWDFKIVKLSSINLPFTYFVDCDGSENVATLLIQK